VVIIVSTADQVESYVGRGPRTAQLESVAPASPTWTGCHRAEARTRLTFGRMFYVARHRGRQRTH
jgi:hypothetical protein